MGVLKYLRVVIFLLLLGTILNYFLDDGLQYISYYYISKPTGKNNKEKFILVHDSNSTYHNSNSSESDQVLITNAHFKPVISSKAVYSAVNNTFSPDSFFRVVFNGSTNTQLSDSYTKRPFKLLNASEGVKHVTRNAVTQRKISSGSNIAFTTVETAPFAMIHQNCSLPKCPATPPGLVGPIKVWFDEPTFEEIERLNPYLELGGHGKPKNCLARHRVAIVIPYRDREAHLRILLHNLHSLLTKQQLDYAVFVVEQYENETFNRGKLMNVGYTEAMKLYDWQCLVFHDVDLLPEDDRNIYSCPDQPRHMSVAIDKFHYKLPYRSIFGGISAITTEQFRKINGFSNDYWGWGGEDDDLSTRVTSAGYKIMRYPSEIARYKMIKHKSETKNPVNRCRYELMAQTKMRLHTDGVSSLKYKLYDLQLRPLFTHLKVKLLETQSKIDLRKQGFKNC